MKRKNIKFVVRLCDHGHPINKVIICLLCALIARTDLFPKD